jgi:hypothetical protein
MYRGISVRHLLDTRMTPAAPIRPAAPRLRVLEQRLVQDSPREACHERQQQPPQTPRWVHTRSMKDSPRSAPLAATVRGPTPVDTPAHVCHARVKVHSVAASAGHRASRKYLSPSLFALYLNAPQSTAARSRGRGIRGNGPERGGKWAIATLPKESATRVPVQQPARGTPFGDMAFRATGGAQRSGPVGGMA